MGDALTEQERRVATLVADGLSNKAIARELTVSIKTVEFHLGNIYRKLGVSSRGELAAQFQRSTASKKSVGNLPTARVLIGRDDDLSTLDELLTRARLVSLVGVGGVGKTQLAVAAANGRSENYREGAWLVELGSARDADDVANTAAAALGLRSQAAARGSHSVAEALGDQERLIVLDNCEHVLAAAAQLAGDIVAACPAITVLATTRERLDIDEEHVLPISPISFDLTLGEAPALQLFNVRAAAALGRFDPSADERRLVADICRQLDGLPLAIELATSRLPALGLNELHDRLRDRFRLLTRRRDDGGRHASLQATVEWSYGMLTDAERALFDALSCFSGDFDQPAAVAVVELEPDTASDALAALVERSMVVAIATAVGRRYRLLETLREFGVERLREGHTETEVRRRHLAHFLRFAKDADTGIRGPGELLAHQRLLADWHNLRDAVTHACDEDDGDAAISIVESLLWWIITRLRADASEWVSRVRQLPSLSSDPRRTIATAAQAFLTNLSGDVQGAAAIYAEAIDDEAKHGSLPAPWVPAIGPFILPWHEGKACTLETQRRAQRDGDLFWKVVGVLQEGIMILYEVHTPAAIRPVPRELITRLEADLALTRQLGCPNGVAYGQMNLGGVLTLSDPARGTALLQRSLDEAVPLGLTLLAGQARGALASLSAAGGDLAMALRLATDAIRDHLSTGALSEFDGDLLIALPILAALERFDVIALVGGARREFAQYDDTMAPVRDAFAEARLSLGDARYMELVREGATIGPSRIMRHIEVIASELG